MLLFECFIVYSPFCINVHLRQTNVPLDTCFPRVDVVSTTISKIGNIGSPTPDVTCSGQGVTVENGTIMVLCGCYMNGDTIVYSATKRFGSEVFYLLFFQEGTFVTAVMQQASCLSDFV